MENLLIKTNGCFPFRSTLRRTERNLSAFIISDCKHATELGELGDVGGKG